VNANNTFEAFSFLAGILTLNTVLQSGPEHAIFIQKILKKILGREHSPLFQREGAAPPAPTPSAPTAPRPGRLWRSTLGPPLQTLDTPLIAARATDYRYA